jgi:uncharacterized membrane protein YedE/YeeE
LAGLILSMSSPLFSDNVKFAVDNIAPSWFSVIAGGACVGWGTRQGNGCTSGHGICGLSRLSKRGFVAVCSFMTAGIITSSLLSSFAPALLVGDISTSQTTTDLSTPLLQKITKESWNTMFTSKTFPLFLWPLAVLLFGLFQLFRDSGKKRQAMKEHLVSVVSGMLFSFGLLLSGMVNVWKVKNFLWFAPGHWDPSLIFVMGLGVGIALLPTWWLLTKSKWEKAMYTQEKLYTGKSLLETSKTEKVDRQLLTGAAIFGVGWGLSGLCPGPAYLSAVNGVPKVILGFIPSFLVGSFAFGKYNQMKGKTQ